MNGCDRLSDRMPEVLLHRSAWSPEEAAHLAGCAECRAEWKLVQAARALDEGAPTVSDPSALAAALGRRLAEDRAVRARVRRGWAFAGAAAVAAGLLVAVMTGREPDTAGVSPAATRAEALVPLPELEGLETAQLDTLLRSIDRPFAGTSSLEASTLGEYDDGELEQVFATWEG